MRFAETLTPSERKKYRMYAYASTWFGCIAEAMVDSSAIIILFITTLGGSATFTMLSTTLTGIFQTLLLIFLAGLTDKIGLKKMMSYGCYFGCAGYLIMASAGAFPEVWGKYIVMAGCAVYCFSRPLYGVTWYPMLDNFLLPEDRGGFFGFMRFSYMLINSLIFFVVGLVMGKEPPLWLFSLVIGITGILILGRKYCIDQFPMDPAPKPPYDLKKSLSMAMKNGPLISFSIYVLCISVAYCSIIPLAFIYLKKWLNIGDNIVQIISVISMAGSILAYLIYGKILKTFGMKTVQLALHVSFIITPLLLFWCGKGVPNLPWLVCGGLFVSSFTYGCFFCCVSTEMLALARPGNQTMASAVCVTYQQLGNAVGRLSTAFALGSGLLVPMWSKWNIEFTSYQTLFLLYGFMALFFLILLPSLPSIVPKHEDYYEPR